MIESHRDQLRWRVPRNRAPHASLWRLAAPMMLSNVSFATLGLVDTAVIGHLENASYLAGIVIASVLFDFLYWGVTFLRMGTTGVVAQVYGANDQQRFRSTLRDALLVAMALAFVMLVFRDDIRAVGLAALHSSEESTKHAAAFFSIKIWGAPGVLATMVFIGWLIGMQNARAAMLLAAVPCLVHVGLDFLLVVHFKLGIAGAAYAALATAYFSAGLGILLVKRELDKYQRGDSIGWQWLEMRRLLTLNWNILLRTFCLIGTFAYFTKEGASHGDIVLAANGILLNFQMLTALALDGFANALEALVGGSIGSSDREKFLAVITVGVFWSVLFALLFVALYAVIGNALIGLLTNIVEVRVQSERFFVWAMVSPIVSVWCFLFDGIFIGSTKGREMRNSMVFSALCVFLPASYLLQPLGNHGLWLAFLLFFAARGFSMAWYFVKIDRAEGFVG
jgi:MATE family multidrug resistance protein